MARASASETYDVVVIGGGASGLAASLAAARAGARCAVIERDVACGLPILATGNGRCNLSNAHLHPTHYRHPEAARGVMGPEPERELEEWFAGLGLMTCREGELLFPLSKRAESVRDALLAACARENVTLISCCEVVRAVFQEDDASWKLDLLAPTKPVRAGRARDAKSELRALRKALVVAPKRSHVVEARAIVIAAGGACENACQLFGINHLDEAPALCPISCTPAEHLGRGAADLTARLDGLRVEGALSLVREGGLAWRERGEVLFRAYGLSGVVVFNLSRRAESGDTVELDLFPDTPESELVDTLREREDLLGPLTDRAYRWFDGVLAPALGRAIVILGRGDIHATAHLMKHLAFRVGGTTETRSAQVRRGGIPISDVQLPELVVRRLADDAPLSPNTLFACGEALDMDADCGGFNLAWAWLSGTHAGRSAARAARDA